MHCAARTVWCHQHRVSRSHGRREIHTRWRQRPYAQGNSRRRLARSLMRGRTLDIGRAAACAAGAESARVCGHAGHHVDMLRPRSLSASSGANTDWVGALPTCRDSIALHYHKVNFAPRSANTAPAVHAHRSMNFKPPLAARSPVEPRLNRRRTQQQRAEILGW